MRLPLLLAAIVLLGACDARSGAGTVAPAGSSAASHVPQPPPSAAAGMGTALPDQFVALGTEPFWAARVAGDRLVYTTPEDQAGEPVTIARGSSPTSVELRGELAGKRFVLVITGGPCSDGMSDAVYPFAAVLTVGDERRKGCARPDESGPG